MGAEGVDGHDPLELGRIGVDHGVAPAGDAGRVHEDVDGPEVLEHGLAPWPRPRRRDSTDGPVGRGPAAQRLDGLHRLGGGVGVAAVVHGHVEAVAGQRQRAGPPDPPAPPGDERHPAPRDRSTSRTAYAAGRNTGTWKPVADVREVDPQRHAHRQVVELAPHHVGHHPGPLGQVDHGGHVGHPLVERRQVVLVHDRPGVEGGVPAGLLPRHGVGPAAGAEGPGVVVGLAAGGAAHDEEPALGDGVPPRLGEVVGGGQIEAGRRHGVCLVRVSEWSSSVPAVAGVPRRLGPC